MIKYIKPNKLLMTINNVYLNLLIFMNFGKKEQSRNKKDKYTNKDYKKPQPPKRTKDCT